MDQEIFELLSSNTKLHRDRGLLQLRNFLDQPFSPKEFEKQIVAQFSVKSEKWEEKHALLSTRQVILQSAKCKDVSEDFLSKAKAEAILLLEDNEYRVRISAGELLGSLCSVIGTSIYDECREQILTGVRSNLERHAIEDANDKAKHEKLKAKLVSQNVDSELKNQIDGDNSISDVFHDTAGWKHLETWMACLKCIIVSLGEKFYGYLDDELLQLIFISLEHTNRFVRETGYNVCESIVTCGLVGKGKDDSEQGNLQLYGEKLTQYLAAGLADNWSQVRLSSSLATRQFILSLPSDELRHKYYPILLPAMCLNRYYVAEGVRIISQETWRLVASDTGPKLVETYIKQVVEFYIRQSEADNHAVREAACSCIAELASKVNKDSVRLYVPDLLDALLVCFKDDSWPVRDTSCVACGQFILCFPEECKAKMDTLYELFFMNLEDCISSVRQGAAQALSNVVKAYGEDSMKIVSEKLDHGFENIKNQAANAEKYSGMEAKPAVYGVVKRMRDNDADIHTNKQMYSCGSLAPKMHAGKRGGGCMDHQFRQPSEPWMLTDGCLMLIGALSSVATSQSYVIGCLPAIVKVTTQTHYTQHVHLLETFCKQIPIICQGLGKQKFKAHIETFLDSIMNSLTCDNAGTSLAALECLNDLSKLLGPNILKGRLENYNPRYLEMYESKQMHVY